MESHGYTLGFLRYGCSGRKVKGSNADNTTVLPERIFQSFICNCHRACLYIQPSGALIDKIDDFLPYKPSLKSLLLYVLFNFPRYLLYLLPMAILLCSLFVFSQAKKREEITAIKAAGGRLKTIMRPFWLEDYF